MQRAVFEYRVGRRAGILREMQQRPHPARGVLRVFRTQRLQRAAARTRARLQVEALRMLAHPSFPYRLTISSARSISVCSVPSR